MTPEELKQFTISMIEEGVKTGNIDAMREHPGLQEIIPTVEQQAQALSDRSVRFPLVICEGEWVACVAVFTGTHTGDFFGNPPTGKRIEYEVLMFNRLVDGKVVKQYSAANGEQIRAAMGS